jgi:hypothetical protein
MLKIDERRRLETLNGTPASNSTPRTISEAAQRFLRVHGEVDRDRHFHGDLQFSTWRKYRTKLTLFGAFCGREGNYPN